jgi:hypothetical protein
MNGLQRAAGRPVKKRELPYRVKVSFAFVSRGCLPRKKVVTIRHVEVNKFNRHVRGSRSKAAALRAPRQIMLATLNGPGTIGQENTIRRYCSSQLASEGQVARVMLHGSSSLFRRIGIYLRRKG